MRALVLIAILTIGFAINASAAGSKKVFPSIITQDLNGTNLRLPEDFRGDLNLVIFAFKRGQQAFVDSWLPAADDLATRYGGFDYYELPSVGRQPGFMKTFIDNGMRSGIADTDTRGRTITLYVPKKSLMNSMEMKSDRTIYAMLLDRQDRVIWQAEGAATKATLDSLRKAVAKEF